MLIFRRSNCIVTASGKVTLDGFGGLVVSMLAS